MKLDTALQFFSVLLISSVILLASAQTGSKTASGTQDLLNLFSSAFGGRDGQNLLNRFINLLSGDRGKNYGSASLGAFFRDSVFDNLVKQAYELNNKMNDLQHKTRNYAYDMERIRHILERGGSAEQVLSVLKQSDNLPSTVNSVFSQNQMVGDLNRNFTKFMGEMRALRAAFSNEEGIGDTLKELISESQAADVPGSNNSRRVGEIFSRFLRVLRGEGIQDLSFRDLGLCSTNDQCQKMQRGLQDLKRIFTIFTPDEGSNKPSRPPPRPRPRPQPRPAPRPPPRPLPGRRVGQQKLSEDDIETYYPYYS